MENYYYLQKEQHEKRIPLKSFDGETGNVIEYHHFTNDQAHNVERFNLVAQVNSGSALGLTGRHYHAMFNVGHYIVPPVAIHHTVDTLIEKIDKKHLVKAFQAIMSVGGIVKDANQVEIKTEEAFKRQIAQLKS